MDLTGFTVEELLLAGLKSEIDSRDAYNKLADKVTNWLLKDRLKFLAGEEEKHRALLEQAHKRLFPDTQLIIPGSSPVPLPAVIITDETVPISGILESAMTAELAAAEFYKALAYVVTDDRVKRMVMYFAKMEEGHYKLLENELESIDQYEDFDTYWPMMHAGP